MTKKTTLLFDFDGTIMDTTNVIVQSWQQVYRHVTGKEGDPDTILGTFGTVLRDGLADAFPGEPVEELLKIYREFQYEDVVVTQSVSSDGAGDVAINCTGTGDLSYYGGKSNTDN